MHRPMHSFGESSTQPNTPCSASGECGGKRSTLSESDEIFLRRRAFFKSAAAPARSETESIILQFLPKRGRKENNRKEKDAGSGLGTNWVKATVSMSITHNFKNGRHCGVGA